MPNGNGGNGFNLPGIPGETVTIGEQKPGGSDWSWVGETVREWTGQWLVDKKVPVEYSMSQEDKQMLVIGALALILLLK